ncbi:ribonuclease P protein component [Gilvimarinus sp. DA14]|uniref:ribonuclease P protein component n=1 Tax=Gilvimarinus sp. DA14 TaxID=2956798 RepID=UPI0020B79F1A|nr:ribonuclease P protein component [Gilvimarinus sp. DA14]UTF59064.1 ribonuclease P protein component [Gilvimarinus sp. DA14]
MSTSLAFRKHQRLLNARDFKAVFDDAPFRASHQHLLLLSRDNQSDCARLGLVIAKKNIRHAVDRNRVKRLIRESFRQHQHQLAGLDVIVLARRGLDELDNPSIHKLLSKQWQRIIRKRDQASGDQT